MDNIRPSVICEIQWPEEEARETKAEKYLLQYGTWIMVRFFFCNISKIKTHRSKSQRTLRRIKIKENAPKNHDNQISGNQWKKET